ncbi:MAG: hypothetical protein II124_07560 [Clostridia bacterium]|nr:hypothetical protein [Clostridia bacterium]
MGFNIAHLSKYLRWLRKDRENYRDACLVSKELAKIERRLNYVQLFGKTEKAERLSDEKHDWILRYIEGKCPETLNKYRNMAAPSDVGEPNPTLKVWSMWWQGEQNADKLFRMCIDSARRHTHQPVVTLDKDNYRDHFEIPEHVLRKHAEGKIALQHICDLMVVSILAAEGGFFTGATVWWSQDASEELLRAPFWTCRAVSESHVNMSRSRWVGYVLAGRKEFPLFSFARDCLHEYWKNCDKAVDYLMLDYIFELAYRNIPCVREAIDALPEKNNMLRNELIMHLSDPYDPESFKRYTEGDTFMYKLSWKFGRKDEMTGDGRMTNYGAMLRECGEEF